MYLCVAEFYSVSYSIILSGSLIYSNDKRDDTLISSLLMNYENYDKQASSLSIVLAFEIEV